jgi:hypothetical protein
MENHDSSFRKAQFQLRTLTPLLTVERRRRLLLLIQVVLGVALSALGSTSAVASLRWPELKNRLAPVAVIVLSAGLGTVAIYSVLRYIQRHRKHLEPLRSRLKAHYRSTLSETLDRYHTASGSSQ